MPKVPGPTRKQDVKCHTITSLFKKQVTANKYITCPACSKQVGLSAINKHLDETCLAFQDKGSDDTGNSISECNRKQTISGTAVIIPDTKSSSVETEVEILDETVVSRAEKLQKHCGFDSNSDKKLTAHAGDHIVEKSDTPRHVNDKGIALTCKLSLKRKYAKSVPCTNQEIELKNECNQETEVVELSDKNNPKQCAWNFSSKILPSRVEGGDDDIHFQPKLKIIKQLSFDNMLVAQPTDEWANTDHVGTAIKNSQQLAPKSASTASLAVKSSRHLSRNVTAPSLPVVQSIKIQHPTSSSPNLHQPLPKNPAILAPDKSLKVSEQFNPVTPARATRSLLNRKTENEQMREISSSVKKSSPKKRSPLLRKIRAAQNKIFVKNSVAPKSPGLGNPSVSSNLKSPVSTPYKLSNNSVANIQIQDLLSAAAGDVLNEALVASPSSSRTLGSSSSESPSQTSFEKTCRPYYLENFLFILKTVLSHPDDSCLFNDSDKHVIDGFYDLPVEAQKLYVRMFQRKQKWHQVSKIEYPDISNNTELVAQNLTSEGLMLSGADLDSSELRTVLEIMKLPDLKMLCKALNVNCNAMQKTQIVDQITKQSRQQRTIFSMSGGANFAQVALKRAKCLLGSCMKVATEPKRVFIRAMILFSLTNQSLMEDDKQNQQLLTLLFINMGKITFPPYTVLREVKIFRHRVDLMRYETASQLEYDIITLTESGNWTAAHDLYIQSKALHQDVQKDLEFHAHVMTLPTFLKRFTAGAVYVRCMSYGVEVLQRLRKYSDAVELLEALLEESVFHLDYRGRWMERLALNLEQHLKRPKDALTVLIKAFGDPYVTAGHRLSLHQRATRICNSASHTALKPYLREVPEIPLYEIPKVYIEGRQLPRGSAGGKAVFLAEGSQGNNEVDMCSVEEFVIKHYQNLGYNEGIHGESATFLTMHCLLFWDIIFISGIPDVFRSPFQHMPLDINYGAFYTSRKVDIDERLQWISESPIEVLVTAVQDCWTIHLEELSLVSWNLFRGVEQVQSLVKCFRPPVLAKICERYAKEYRHCRSGFPDLVVWNSTTSECRVIEVKGPNDRLSTKQILWLDYLLGIGVTAEVCHVTVGKKLQKNRKKKESPKKPP